MCRLLPLPATGTNEAICACNILHLTFLVIPRCLSSHRKKHLTKRPAASTISNDKATSSALPSSTEDTTDRPRKSFFSFKASSKRSTSRPAVSQERQQNSGAIQFPQVGSPKSTTPANPPYQLEIPIRNLRSSILFSQQFDLKNLGTNDEPLHRDPSPTPLLSDTPSRPIRSTTRPASWMMMNDGTFAPPLKAQLQSRSKSDQCSPESFYNGSRMPNRIESSDEEDPSRGSTVNWNRLPAVPQPQPAKMVGVLAGYQVRPPAPVEPVASAVTPRRLQPSVTIRCPPSPRLPLPPAHPARLFRPPAHPDRLLSKSAVPASTLDVTKTIPSSSHLLSAFLGSQSTPRDDVHSSDEAPAALPIIGSYPEPPTLVSKARSSDETSTVSLNVRSAEFSTASPTSRASERSSLVDESANKVASDDPPTSPLSISSSPVGKPDAAVPEASEATAELQPRKEHQAEGLETVAPIAIPVRIPPASRSSSWSTPCPPGSICSESMLISSQPSPSRASSMATNSALSSYPPEISQRGGSRKRSVEKVYLDSCSQHSSSSSDNYSSAGSLDATKNRNRKGSSSGAVTDPSSACSNSSSPPEGTLDRYKQDGHPSKSGEETVVVPQDPKSETGEPDNKLDTEKDNASHGVSEEAEVNAETPRQPKVTLEQLVCHPDIFRKIICHLDYLDFFSLSQISHEFQEELEDDPRLREIILKRYLSVFGYRSLSAQFRTGHGQRELVTISLKDLANFNAGLEFESLELIAYAKQALNPKGLDYRTAKMIRSSNRAHNKLVAYLRAIEELDPVPVSQHRSAAAHRHAGNVIYRSGKAALFKVWVPCADHWMSNEELAECERELWRSQVWSYLKKGDVCWNLAIGDFGNEGKLLFDGRFLRDLNFEFDEVGHLPSWLNMLDFSPSYFHKIISSSTTSPIFYLDLSSFKEEIRKSLRLSEDKIEVASPQARYRVQRWVYRSVIKIPRGKWEGYVVIEVEGTSEHANDLLKRCCVHSDGSKKATPWRIIREKSRPGKLWIRPVNDDEKKT
ncbi:hypothetical protein PSTT_05150 [Puccinia striiformis]|uniref:F-box domain-containing protein n=1 Tax=Puccinia striiformis TaxID=27350 RepID=A0A2S4VQ47_9BASI|nr:hypothetical protein PSTT_05150 [Puccinia striiformis]